jgi:hypothetical protein
MGDVEDKDDDEWEPVEPVTSPCDNLSGYWGLSAKKASLNRRPIAYTAGGGGAQFSPNTSHVIRKRMVNATLVTGHQADPVHCYKFNILHMNAVPIFYNNYFGSGEDD